jgi:hypothetical protein
MARGPCRSGSVSYRADPPSTPATPRASVSRLTHDSWIAMGSATAAVDAALETSIAQAAGAPTAGGRWRSALITCAALATLLVGGRPFVDGAISLAQAVGISERIVGLTIVALGTTLPELLTSVTAARRGHPDLAVGSNIFNSTQAGSTTPSCMGDASAATRRPTVVELRLSLIFHPAAPARPAVMARSRRSLPARYIAKGRYVWRATCSPKPGGR